MRLLDQFRLRLRSLLRRDDLERELGEELRFHLDQLTEENIAAGMEPEEARIAAQRAIGGIAQYEEECRDMRQMNLIDDLSRNVRHAARTLRRNPGFTVLAALTLGLGIGASTAAFSVIYGVLLKALPFSDPDRLVAVWHRAPGLNIDELEHGASTYLTYRESNRTFEDIALWERREVTVTGHGDPERAQALQVTDGLLPLLRVPPLLGRVFTREDDSPQSPRRAVLSHGYWQRRFGGARDVIGRSLILDGRQYEVIGIMPPSFQFPGADPDLLLPCRFNPAEVRTGAFSYRAIARLRPSVTLQEANADVTRMIPLSFERFPFEPGLTRKMFDEARMRADVRPLAQDVIGGADRVLWILAGTVGIVLLIACANVANLFLVRTEGRQHELAVRTALGASRWRIANDLFCESIGLALAAGAIGFLFAWAGVRLLFHLAPAGLPRIDEIRVDLVVLAFTFAIALVTGIVFGLIPVMRFGALNSVALKEGGRSSSDTRGRHRGRNALVVSEIALALVLLVAAGLMIRTFVALRQVEPGFLRPHQVQAFRLPIPVALIQDPRHVAVNYEQIAKRIQQVPGVLSVGLSTSVTMDGNVASTAMFVEEFPEAGRAMPPVRRHKRVAPGYFETMGNPIIAGRAITWSDLHQGRPVVVVSENFARMYWKNPAEAIGKRVRQNEKNPWREIIGVVGDEHDDGLDQPATAIVYWPMLIHDWWSEPVSVSRAMNFVVRSGRVGSPGFLRELQQAVWSVHPSVPLASVRTLEEIQAASMARTSFALIMLAMAATVALLLGSVGIYGVIAYVAAQRTREIGIRVALGAQIGDVRRLFLRHGLFLATAGIAIGVGVSLALTRAMSALLFGVSPMDPATYTTVSLGLACVALLATWLPARRASRVDPVAALRSST